MPRSLLAGIFNRRMLLCALLGFASGLPFYTLVSLLPAWLRTEGMALAEIGYLNSLRLPYSWKFVWAPLVDHFRFPWLGRHRDWMLLTQFTLLGLLAMFGLLARAPTFLSVASLTLVVALFSATQDIALDAYRRELLPDEELGLGNSIWVNTYRVAGLIPGGAALLLAAYVPWSYVHGAVAACMAVGIGATWFAPELPEQEHTPKDLKAAILGPFVEFFTRSDLRAAFVLLAFLFLYKLGDNLATALATPFYLDMGYTLVEIGSVVKAISLSSMLFGGVLGGVVILRIGINRALWVFGGVQMASIVGFAVVAELDRNLWVLGAAVLFEYLGVGLGTAAFVAFISRTTSKRFSATQYALFSSFIALPGTVAGAFAGKLIEHLGYTMFFGLCTLLAVPGMIMLLWVAPFGTRRQPAPG